MEQMTELDNRFHHILYDACESQDAGSTACRFSPVCAEDQTEDAFYERKRQCSPIDEHRQILEAIKAGDADWQKDLQTMHMIMRIITW